MRNISQSSDFNTMQSHMAASGMAVSGSDSQLEREIFLQYASKIDNRTVVSGSSDVGVLSGLRDALLQLKSDFMGGSISMKGE